MTKFQIPLLVVLLRAQETVKNVRVTGGMHSVGDLFKIQRKGLTTLIRVVEPVLDLWRGKG